ncbi:uncharacterized protein SCHCODRAFT_02219088 [Schizophyllum commune H4-8]|uniref:uncharacterized protein n=1 Tax=Schizophyllum commune (strain H4-8 / FGSC 9210) TaxID=578458 RepID=UPI00215FA65C|nr:uncharacterized protein SCHCODRAFT_02219088 [Schizophyllum commune H4-8]KAI5894930.1 hypothetical protein SCHCODRAFT_02219088 [Schizophyllum commune H4-8]
MAEAAEVGAGAGEAALAVEAAQAGALEVGADEGRAGPLVVVQGAEGVVEEALGVVRGRSTSSPTTKGVMTMHPHLPLARHAVERSPLHQRPAKRRPHDLRPTRAHSLPRLAQRYAHRAPHLALKHPHHEPQRPPHEPPHPPLELLPPRAANAPAGAPPRARPGTTPDRTAGAGTSLARPRSAGSSSGRTNSQRQAFRRRDRWQPWCVYSYICLFLFIF